MKRRLFPRCSALFALPLILGLAACEHEARHLTVNEPPAVLFTSAAIVPDRQEAVFSWAGSDEDGSIVAFEYAVDDPQAPGAWIRTDEPGCVLRFGAPGSASGGGEAFLTTGAVHAISLRALDDGGAQSKVERLFFTEFTVLPYTHLTSPSLTGMIAQTPADVRFAWVARDADPPAPDAQVAGFRYKLVRVRDAVIDWDTGAVSESLGVLRNDGSVDPAHAGYNWALPDSVLADPSVPESAKKEWLPLSGQTQELWLTDLTDGGYAFGVRAVDWTGAIERGYARRTGSDPGNILIFDALGSIPAAPRLRFSSPVLSSASFLPGQPDLQFDAPAETPIECVLTASAEHYGGTVEAFRHQLEGGEWSEWSSDGRFSLVLSSAEAGLVRALHLEARDTEGRTGSGTVLLNVVAMLFDKEILIIDDFADYVGVSDVDHDAYLDRVLAARHDYAGPAEIDWINGPGADGTEPPPPPSLEMLGHYRLVIVYHQESGTNPGDFSALGNLTSGDYPVNPRHLPKRRALAAYVAAGGKLWLWGVAPAGGLQGDNYWYPKEPYNPEGQETLDPAIFGWDSFLYRFLHIREGRIEINREARGDNVFMGALPSADAAARGYPALEIDRTRLPDPARGMAGTDALLGAALTDPGLETLYLYQAKFAGSQFQDRPAALLYRSPDGSQGDIAYFGFYLYYLQEATVRVMCDRVFEDLLGTSGGMAAGK